MANGVQIKHVCAARNTFRAHLLSANACISLQEPALACRCPEQPDRACMRPPERADAGMSHKHEQGESLVLQNFIS